MTIQKDQFETIGDALLVRAPAKINLSLLIAGKRADGFHEISTVMAKVNLYDELLIEKSQKDGIQLICTGRYRAPHGTDNLVYRASQLLCERTKTRPAIKLTLKKNIPAGAGLGSASSDAAAALIGLNSLLCLGLSPDRLTNMAAELGSDVPFFLDGPLALCTGRGEKIEKVRKIFEFSAILVLPNISVVTKRAYGNYRHDADTYNTLGSTVNKYLKKNRIDLISRLCANMFSESCFQLHPELADLKAEIEALGIGPLCLSGSGSAMFAILDRDEQPKAEQYHRMLEQSVGCESVIVNNNRW